MNEPSGATVDGTPWEEARGPHLPDRLTRVPILVWPFVALAVVQVVVTWTQYRVDLDGDPGMLFQFALSVAIDASAILLGAALFLRHPDAVRTAPLLVVGTSLLAVEQAAGLLRQPLFESLLAPQIDAFDTPTIVTMLPSTTYGWVVVTIGAVGMWSLASGLDRARRHGRGVSRPIFAALAVIAVLQTAVRVAVNVPALEASTGAVGPTVVLADAVVSLASGLILAYFFVVAFAGWRNGERPSIGWAFAALAGGLAIAVPAAFSAVVTVSSDDWSGLPFAVTLALIATAPLALLAAFAVGLPSTEGDVTPDPPGATTPGSAGS